jgi:hypothetical protein
MLISKAVGQWDNSTDDCTFTLEVVGHTPEEVEHLKMLAEELLSKQMGTLQVIPLEEQVARKQEADAKESERKRLEDEDNKKHATERHKAQVALDKRNAELKAKGLPPEPVPEPKDNRTDKVSTLGVSSDNHTFTLSLSFKRSVPLVIHRHRKAAAEAKAAADHRTAQEKEAADAKAKADAGKNPPVKYAGPERRKANLPFQVERRRA